jgi:hypothetical protein
MAKAQTKKTTSEVETTQNAPVYVVVKDTHFKNEAFYNIMKGKKRVARRRSKAQADEWALRWNTVKGV